MKTIHYTLTFFSDWHCGSGLSAGADLDALVVKDAHGLPFVPGKTIKGLLREQVEMLIDARKLAMAAQVKDTFGEFTTQQGTLFCSNAELPEQKEIVDGGLVEYLYRSLSFTAIGEEGVAQTHSLRKMEAVVPCSLEGWISGIPDDMYDIIKDGLSLIKRLGTHRSRGLGRCQFAIKD